jgi:hypothetical protein
MSRASREKFLLPGRNVYPSSLALKQKREGMKFYLAPSSRLLFSSPPEAGGVRGREEDEGGGGDDVAVVVAHSHSHHRRRRRRLRRRPPPVAPADFAVAVVVDAAPPPSFRRADQLLTEDSFLGKGFFPPRWFQRMQQEREFVLHAAARMWERAATYVCVLYLLATESTATAAAGDVRGNTERQRRRWRTTLLLRPAGGNI